MAISNNFQLLNEVAPAGVSSEESEKIANGPNPMMRTRANSCLSLKVRSHDLKIDSVESPMSKARQR
jgi:hypothetical protein